MLKSWKGLSPIYKFHNKTYYMDEFNLMIIFTCDSKYKICLFWVMEPSYENNIANMIDFSKSLNFTLPFNW